jgi:hypothetical protein
MHSVPNQVFHDLADKRKNIRLEALIAYEIRQFFFTVLLRTTNSGCGYVAGRDLLREGHSGISSYWRQRFAGELNHASSAFYSIPSSSRTKVKR